jgi:LacI family transcriptional regulator
MGKRRRVAVMIDLDWPFKYHVEVYAGCQQYAAEVGWDCTINPFADRALKSRRGASPYDGILGRIGPQLVDTARRGGVSVVNVWMNSSARDLPSVFPDTGTAGAMAARHLMARGFRQFGYLGFSREASSRLELAGFRSAVKGEGFSCSVHRYPMSGPSKARTWDAFMGGVAAWVDTWTTPLGVFGTRDLPCRYLMDVCRSKGLHVPQDVAVIGMCNEEVICASPPPTLTSIDLGFTKIGYEAAALLDRLMDGQKPPTEPLLIPPAELVPRQSTDSYAVDDSVVARALRFIAEHGHEPIKVADVVAVTSTTRRSLERRFAKTFRRSIADEIARLRLERAKRRLVESDELLKNVAVASGFSSLHHFYRAFVRVEGVSPKAYRQQRRQDA